MHKFKRMDYNTQREKLLMPEYGRHVQKMIEYVKSIPDREKRNEQIRAVVAVMGVLNPQLRDLNDFKHKLWDHVYIISDFDIDIDSPYPVPTKETFSSHPDPIPLESVPIRERHYGRNIQNMIDVIAAKEDDQVKSYMIKTLAYYMQQQYFIWKKDSASEEIIFKDIDRLSGGKIKIPEDMHLEPITLSGNGAKTNGEHKSYNNQHKNNSNQGGKKNKKKKYNKPNGGVH